MARATVFRFKGTADPLEAGRSLGVGAVLTGSVSRRGGQVSVSAELVETKTGARLWGERYDRPFAELIRLQDLLATGAAKGLRLQLSGEEKRNLSRFGTDNAEAYDLVLRARQLFARETEEDDLEARRLFLQAIEKDPRFAEAYLGLRGTYTGPPRTAGCGPPTPGRSRRRRCAKAARDRPGERPGAGLACEPAFPRRLGLGGRRARLPRPDRRPPAAVRRAVPSAWRCSCGPAAVRTRPPPCWSGRCESTPATSSRGSTWRTTWRTPDGSTRRSRSTRP